MTDTKHTLPKGVWIEHTPGECPVPEDTMVRITRADTTKSEYLRATYWNWDLCGDGTITHYMIELPAELTRLRAQKAALVEALKFIRTSWAGHSEQCNLVKTHDLGPCDCDWPMVRDKCDAALAQAESDQ
jgi:hypothetical protein